jgi:hypothetical protein
LDPVTQSDRALFDEEEMMYAEIVNPPKKKGKEKDVGKRRAYVRVVTSLGGGSLNLELFCEKVIQLHCSCKLPLNALVAGAEDMLQFPYACEAGQIRRCHFPSSYSWVHGSDWRSDRDWQWWRVVLGQAIQG